MQKLFLVIVALLFVLPAKVYSDSQVSQPTSHLYNPGQLKKVDSKLKVQIGDVAPDFTLKSINGQQVALSQFRGISNVVLSFIPSAWTPVCSGQWAGYNIVIDTFKKHDAVLLGISVDHTATLYAWTTDIGGMAFDILSDFWPHGGVADSFGVLRSDGVADRSLFFINKEGVVTGIIVSDINKRPPLEDVFAELEKF